MQFIKPEEKKKNFMQLSHKALSHTIPIKYNSKTKTKKKLNFHSPLLLFISLFALMLFSFAGLDVVDVLHEDDMASKLVTVDGKVSL